MRRVILSGLIAGAAIVAVCHAVQAQSCYQRSYPSYTPYSYSYPSYSYSAPTYSAPAYVAPAKVYKEEKKYEQPVYLRFLAVLPLVELPSYSAAYLAPAPNGNGNQPQALTPPGQQQPSARSPGAPDPFQTEVLKKLDALDKGLQTLNARVEKLERTRTVPAPVPEREPKEKKDDKKLPPAPPPPKDEDLDKIFAEANRASCAACHQQGKDDKGNSVPDEYGGGFVFTLADGRLNPDLTAAQREAVSSQLRKGKMPKLNSKRAREMKVEALTQARADAVFARLDRQADEAAEKKGTP